MFSDEPVQPAKEFAMVKRLPYLILLLVVPCIVSAQAKRVASTSVQTPQTIGVEFDSWHYDQAQGTKPSELVITVVNTSHKDITAFSVTDDIAYLDGMHDKGERSQDLLGSQEIFAPGSARTFEELGVQPVLSVLVVPDVVIYSDGTATVHNDRSFERLLRNRKERLLAFEKTNDVIKQFGPNHEAIAAELERLAELSKTRKSREAVPSGGVLRMLARQVRQTTDLNQLAKDNQDHIDAILPHLNITRQVQP
jgi:hypothetical protein